MSIAKGDRLVSLDVFRGITIALMVVVNNPGSWSFVYAPLLHAEWNGCTPTDLVFPFFLFITGLSIALGKKVDPENRKPLLVKIVKRSLILFGIGVLLNALSNFDISSLRIPGVLQRIGIVYLVCSILYQYTSTWSQIRLALVILVSYYLLMAFTPVPGVGFPSLEKGESLSGWLDNLLLNGHLWSVTKTWDPEGILTTIPAVVSGLLGVIVGTLLFKSSNIRIHRDVMLASWASIMLALMWNPIFPINKNLWTSSFVLLTSGIGVNVFLLLYWLVDEKKWSLTWVFKPFQIMGTNAIVAYILSSVMATLLYSVTIKEVSLQEWVYHSFLSFNHDPYQASLLYAISFGMVIYIPLYLMYRNKIFVKI